jgi:hypothetical protein|tara:strand:+ start:1288 stop:1398 length:111 start_codon:yes stop_codon:yes gene_type:complete
VALPSMGLSFCPLENKEIKKRKKVYKERKETKKQKK